MSFGIPDWLEEVPEAARLPTARPLLTMSGFGCYLVPPPSPDWEAKAARVAAFLQVHGPRLRLPPVQADLGQDAQPAPEAEVQNPA